MDNWIIKTTRTSKVFSHKIILASDHHDVASIARTYEDDDKTARLVAAAPELLEALQTLVQVATPDADPSSRSAMAR